MKEEVPEGPEPIEYVTISLSASLDTTNRDETKTYLDMDGKVGKVKWSVGDTIMMFNYQSKKIYSCIPLRKQDITDDGCSANFTFAIPTTDTNVIYYYSNYLYYGKPGMSFSIAEDYVTYNASISVETVQNYVAGKGFDDFENIAFGYIPANKYAKGSPLGCTMHNIFGILKVNIQLSDFTSGSKIRSIRLTDKGNNYLAGSFTVTGLESGTPTMVHKAQTGGDSYTVEKRFSSDFTGGDVYFLVPPGSVCTSNGFDIAIYTDSGLYGGKTVKNLGSASIRSNHITPVNLSAFKKKTIPAEQQPTANTYIVPATAGVYSIPAEYPGNGYQGNNSDISSRYGQFIGAKAEIIWEGRLNGESIVCGDIISNPVYIKGSDNNRYISFHRTGKEGCALVALKNSAGEVIWSWTLWITGDGTVPSVWLSKMNGSEKLNVVEIMDRNIGTLNIRNDNNSQSHGLAFQYGRKDAYMGARSQYYTGSVAYASFAAIAPATAIWCETSGQTAESHFSLDYSIKNPNIRLCSSTGSWCSVGVTLWGTSDINSPKSLYDPCPVGWRVLEKSQLESVWTITSGVVSGLDGTVSSCAGGNANTFTLSNNGSPVLFPATGKAENENNVGDIGKQVALWLSSKSEDSQAKYLQMTFKDGACNAQIISADTKVTMPVRCQKWTEPGSTTQSIPAASQTTKSATIPETFELETATID